MKIVPIENYPDHYISDSGDLKHTVLSTKVSGKAVFWITVRQNHNGYNTVDLTHEGKTKHLRLNRLLAKAFLPNPEGKTEVHHINGIKNDDRIENLMWVTSEQHKELHKPPQKPKKDKKLQQRPIEQLSADGDIIINLYQSMLAAERETGVNDTSIWKCCNGQRKTAGGYRWRYAKEET